MDELQKIDDMIEQPPKRKPGRPKGSMSKNKRSPTTVLTVTGQTAKLVPGGDAAGGGAVPDLIGECMKIRAGVNLNDPATLWDAMSKYLQLCAMSGMKISNSLMYLSCGVSRTTISEWEHGTKKKGDPEYRKFASMCREVCAAAREQYGLEGKVNPILTIFHQKFYDGFTDVPQPQEASDPLGEMQDARELAEKYKDLIMD